MEATRDMRYVLAGGLGFATFSTGMSIVDRDWRATLCLFVGFASGGLWVWAAREMFGFAPAPPVAGPDATGGPVAGREGEGT